MTSVNLEKDYKKIEEILSKMSEIQLKMSSQNLDFEESQTNFSMEGKKKFIMDCYQCRKDLVDVLNIVNSLNAEENVELKKNILPSLSNLMDTINYYLVWTLSDPNKINTDEDLQIFCKECSINHAFLFYKMHIDDRFQDFKECEKWVYRMLVKSYMNKNYTDEHLKLVDWWDGHLSEDSVDAVISQYMSSIFIPCFVQYSVWMNWDKKEILFKRKEITKNLKEMYPKATGNCKKMLLSNTSRDNLFQDYFELQQSRIKKKLKDSNLMYSMSNIYDFVKVLVLFLNSFLDMKRLDSEFANYIFNRTKYEFKKSEQENEERTLVQKQEKWEKKQVKESVYNVNNDVSPSVIKKELPEWMEENLKNLDIKDVAWIVKFLRAELTKCWWCIKLSHINTKFERMDDIDSIPDFLSLLDIYPEFEVIDDLSKEEPSEDISDKESMTDIVQEQNKQKQLMDELKEISNIDDMEDRLACYVEMFEKLWYQFRDKEDFLNQFINAVEKTQSDKGRLEKSVQSALQFRIWWNESLEKKRAFWYRAMCLNYNAWRIVLTNMQITHILSHDEYLRLINTKPS